MTGFWRRGARLAATTLGIALAPDAGLAAGYGLREFSALALGSAYAGASAGSGDPGFLHYNPAATGGGEGLEAALGLGAILPSSQARYEGGMNAFALPLGGAAAPAGFVHDAYPPAVALRARLDARTSIGLALASPWGLVTEYPERWAGRYHAVDTEIFTLRAEPSLAFDLGEGMTLGAGLTLQYMRGAVASAIDLGLIGAGLGVPGALPSAQDGRVDIEADDLGFGFTLGAHAEPSAWASLGVTYRSEVRHRLEGDAAFRLDAAGTGLDLRALTGLFADTGVTARVVTPDVAAAGLRLRVAPRFTLGADLAFTRWSKLGTLKVDFASPAQPPEITRFDWQDSWFAALGGELALAQGLTLRAGAAFDQSPTRDRAREPRIPDADRILLAFGASLPLGPRLTLHGAFAHLLLEEEPVRLGAGAPGAALRGTLAGTTEAAAEMILLQITFR